MTNLKLKKKPLIRSDEMTDLKFHPVAAIFPMMDTVEFESLKADIQKHGQLEPIWTHDGKIIDGRNRYLACRELGIEPKIKEWEPVNGAELVDFVISLNLQRRHLTASQKALVAVDSPYRSMKKLPRIA
jgi:ParB-like chromosome segregation protein Spo0J